VRFVDTFDYHRENPDFTLDEYVRSRRIELGESLDSKEKIYLDTKYWIYFRDVILGRTDDDSLVNSYEVLSGLCDDGVAVCPISEDIFYEITKQLDRNTLSASITLIDKLSQGVSLLSQSERMQAEILHFFHRYSYEAKDLYPLNSLVWTKICYSIGTHFPYNTAFPPDDELLIQKSFFDQMWNTTLSELCELIGYDVVNNVPRMPDLSHLLNEDAGIEREKNLRFKEVFIDEIYHLARYIEPMLDEAMEYMYTKETGNIISESEKQAAARDKGLVNMVCNIFRLGKEGNNFPTLKVGAGVHAAVIMDKRRRFSPNDHYDFRHAQAALPYCDYFFTEKNLKHLLTLNSMAYDREYDCKIISKQKDVLEALEDIKAKKDN